MLEGRKSEEVLSVRNTVLASREVSRRQRGLTEIKVRITSDHSASMFIPPAHGSVAMMETDKNPHWRRCSACPVINQLIKN